MAIIKIKAGAKSPTDKAKVKAKVVKPEKPKKGVFRVIGKVGAYFKGAWVELRQVRWPNRRSAWALTSAVIIFTGFFVGLIILLDYAFEMLFKLIVK